MTFDLSPASESRLSAARQLADQVLSPAAAEIDRTGSLPDAVSRHLDALNVWESGSLDAVLMLEALASASASAAARVALGQAGGGEGVAGLRGVALVDDPSDQQRLGLAAVCLGIGRAALDVALDVARQRGDRPAGEPGDPPHWILADAATELDAARLLVRATAAGHGIDAAGALVFAGGAARAAVDAAIRLVGPAAWQPGSVVERCARDIRAALLVAGTEDAARQRAADRLLA